MAIAKKATLRTVHTFVADRVAFNCNGTLTGSRNSFASVGQLPTVFHSEYYRAYKADDFYCVWSYATPIAWFANGVWYVPNVQYTQTTKRHMSAIRLVRDGSVWRESIDKRAWAYCGS